MAPRKSILTNKQVGVAKVTKKEVEGVDYINLNSTSKTEIGKLLSPGAKINSVDSIFGPFNRMQSIMLYINTPNYPVSMLNKSSISKDEARKVSKLPVIGVPNYWSIIMHIMWERLRVDVKTLKMLIELKPDITFTTFRVEEATNRFSDEPNEVLTYNDKLGRYCRIIEVLKVELGLIIEAESNDTVLDLNDSKVMETIIATMDTNMMRLMVSAKDKPDCMVFDAMACETNVPAPLNSL